MLKKLITFLQNPFGWQTVKTIENELRSERGTTLGTYVFQLQQDRNGRRRYLARMQHGKPVSLTRQAVAPSMAEHWVKHGRLPI